MKKMLKAKKAFFFQAICSIMPGMPALRDRGWGVAVCKGRVYYSVWTDVACPNGNCGSPLNATAYQFTTNTPPAIRSVALDPVSGDFLPATDQLEWTGNDFTWNSPITDIDFNAEGQMVVAQKSILWDFSGYNHRSEVAVLTATNGSWTADVFKTGPAESPTNSNRYGTEAYGGVDFGYNGATPEASFWYSSADMVRDGNIVNGSQGPHGFAGTSRDMFTISGLVSKGEMGFSVTANFVGDTDCNAMTTYDAPAQRFVPITSPTPCVSGPGVVGGTVFLDLDNNGADATTELGQAGILVSVFDRDGNEVSGSLVTTDANGKLHCSAQLVQAAQQGMVKSQHS